MAITTAGLAELVNLGIDDSSPDYYDYLAFGTGTNAAVKGDTILRAEVDRVAATCSRITTANANDTMRFAATFSITSSTACTIAEVAVFNAATGGDMLARTVLSTARVVTEGQVYALIYDVALST